MKNIVVGDHGCSFYEISWVTSKVKKIRLFQEQENTPSHDNNALICKCSALFISFHTLFTFSHQPCKAAASPSPQHIMRWVSLFLYFIAFKRPKAGIFTFILCTTQKENRMLPVKPWHTISCKTKQKDHVVSDMLRCERMLLLLLLSHFSRVWLCTTHRWQPTRLPCPWDSPGKNTGVGECLWIDELWTSAFTEQEMYGLLKVRLPMETEAPLKGRPLTSNKCLKF